jgi:hypothetical protein
MRTLALDMGDETDATGIVFVGRIVQALRLQRRSTIGMDSVVTAGGFRGSLGHGALQRRIRGSARLLRRSKPDKQN